MFYFKGVHGVHMTSNPLEREELESTGWEFIGEDAEYEAFVKGSRKKEPTNKLSDSLENKSEDELREIAKERGIKVHHKAGKALIIEKLEA